MKKFASLLLTVVLLATMLTVFAVPASAEDVPVPERTVSVIAAETLGGPENEELEVPVDVDDNVTVPEEGDSGYWQIDLSSTLSEGSLTIIVGVAAAVVFGLGGFILGTKKKKKPALASGENKDGE